MSAPWLQPVSISGGSMSTTFRMYETCETWQEAVCFVTRLRDVKSKPSIRRVGNAWRVSYEPRLISFNYTTGTAA